MKKNDPRNEVDLILEQRLMKLLGRTKTVFAVVDDIGQDVEVPYYYSEFEIKNKACIRQNYGATQYNRFEELYFTKLFPKISKNWKLFWDFVTDVKPKHCFICGKYILKEFRDHPSVIQPYKKSDLCHMYCWEKEMKPEYVTQTRLTEDSDLICNFEKGFHMSGKDVCRKRVKNTQHKVIEHFMNYHKDVRFADGMTMDKVKSLYFLKPNAKKFPRVIS